EIELVGREAIRDVPRQRGMPFYLRQWPRAAAFIGHPVFRAHAQREMRVVIEEERRDVIVVDEEQHVGLLLGQPAFDGLVAREDGRPHRVLLLFRVEREADGGGVRGGDAADYCRHGMLLDLRENTGGPHTGPSVSEKVITRASSSAQVITAPAS